MAKVEAIQAVVAGHDQQVGFRALVMKQAIQYNLGGAAVNDADGTVHFTLQGAKHGIEGALATIRQGTERSSDITVTTSPTTVDPALKTFTIAGWTSSRRNITNTYDLVFKIRADDPEISAKKAEAAWHDILQDTLSPDDLKKLKPDD